MAEAAGEAAPERVKQELRKEKEHAVPVTGNFTRTAKIRFRQERH